MDTITLAEAVRLSLAISIDEAEIVRLEDSNLWKWYRIGYGEINGAYTRREFLRESQANKSSVSKAVRVATAADESAAFRKALESGKFGSLQAAYAAIPKKRSTSRVRVVSVTIKFTADGVELPKGLTAAQRRALKAAL